MPRLRALSLGSVTLLASLFGCLEGGIEGVRGTPTTAALAGSDAVGGSSDPSSGGSDAAGRAAGMAGSSARAGAGNGGTACGVEWSSGTDYVAGDVVAYQGGYYVAEHENPGYDPIISTWFWEPYSCEGGSSGGSGAGGSGPALPSSFSALVSESVFNQMFPSRNGFYTYQGLLAATGKYPAFSGAGSDEQRKREAAAFLANVARETGLLVYIDQIAKEDYCSASSACPCEAGRQYYGRGPIQISWNYNYCAAGAALGYDLRAQPELVAQNATIAWATGLWFWMTQRGAGSFTAHDAIVNGHGFGETIRSINGGQECGQGGSEGASARADFYRQFCALLGVSPGDGLSC
jgi:predicted chitinase